jgi:glycosyltransferase involved in cell wall biosynthesis
MKILIVSHKIPPDYSGVGERSIRHAEYLNSVDSLFGVITLTNNINSDNVYLNKIPENKIISLFQFKILKKNKIHIFLKFFNILILSFLLLKIFIQNKKNIDVVHSFTSHYLSALTCFFAVIFKIKFVIESTLLGDDSRNKGMFSSFYNFIYTNSSFIICISPLLKKIFEQDGFPKDKILIIPNDIDTNRFNLPSNKQLARKSVNFNDGYINLLFVGVANTRKGFDTVFKIFEKLSNRHKINLHVVGSTEMILDYDKIMFQNILKQIEKFNLQNKIFFHGRKNNVHKYMQASDFFLFPSRKEGFGTVQIEAMACGSILVSSFLKGITDFIIDNGVNGCYIQETENIDAFVEIVENLIHDKESYETISNNGAKHAYNKFSRVYIMKKYLNIYNKLINEDSNPS